MGQSVITNTSLTDERVIGSGMDGQLTSQGGLITRNATNVIQLAPGTAGQVLLSQGAGANLVWGNITGSSQIFTSSGTLTVPATRVLAVCIAAGAGGGWWGGGGGALIAAIISGLTIGAEIAIVVGDGGVGAIAGNGTDGGDSYVTGYLRAKGGSGNFTTGCKGGDYYAQNSVLLLGLSCRSNRLNIIDFTNQTLISDMDGHPSPAIEPPGNGNGGISGSLAAGGVYWGGAGSLYGAGGAAYYSYAPGGNGGKGVVAIFW